MENNEQATSRKCLVHCIEGMGITTVLGGKKYGEDKYTCGSRE